MSCLGRLVHSQYMESYLIRDVYYCQFVISGGVTATKLD